MSEAEWRAVLVRPEGITVWPMQGDHPCGSARELAADAIPTLPGPLVVAGLPVKARAVPIAPDLTSVHAPDLPQVAAIPPLEQFSPAARTMGAETAIAGYLCKQPNFDGVLLVPDGSTCWAHISAGEVVSFQTFLTPKLLDALDAPPPKTGSDFETALNDTLSRPERLAQHLASAHFSETGQDAAHLIGAEIAAAKPYWLGQNVVILAGAPWADAYVAALASVGAEVRQSPLVPALLAGFTAAWHKIAS